MPRACQVLAAQPFSVMLGAKLLALDLGHAEVAVPKGANVGQRNGIAQGDLIAFLADAAVNYMRVAHDQELVARAAPRVASDRCSLRPVRPPGARGDPLCGGLRDGDRAVKEVFARG